ncbi:DNA polymerase III subunit epsilon [Methylophilaceae bacterium]|jgi:DNA polymerase III subunit epsilon|nr:DNA polymerase III subunit epsilon [Methylophilaceae bacterium]|tara:strand:- start:995 stop:1663 length:669 start_codon:yes stop_codon:yes gene_type:complete
MRQIFLDTETTGLDPNQGHRVIEIAAIEMNNRQLTKNHYHTYLNPKRNIDQAAQDVHGITAEFLQDKPLFKDVASDFINFIKGSEIIIHNAPFDVGFLNMELGKINLDKLESYSTSIFDTLKLAKEIRPGQRNNLDALCKAYDVDNTSRAFHGALLDAQLLGDVYIGMTRGQEVFSIDFIQNSESLNLADINQDELFVVNPSSTELQAHDKFISNLETDNEQ